MSLGWSLERILYLKGWVYTPKGKKLVKEQEEIEEKSQEIRNIPWNYWHEHKEIIHSHRFHSNLTKREDECC